MGVNPPLILLSFNRLCNAWWLEESELLSSRHRDVPLAQRPQERQGGELPAVWWVQKNTHGQGSNKSNTYMGLTVSREESRELRHHKPPFLS
jgi:hypothetical protein